MRKVIVAATLALSPMLLHAQAISPVQPKTSSALPLQSKLIQPAAFSASDTPGASDTGAVSTVRVSTGIEVPELIHTTAISSDSDWRMTPVDKTVVVGMIVDETGTPSELKILDSAEPSMNNNVLAAVKQYRFKPGTLDRQPIAVPLKLTVVLHTAN